MSGGRLRRLPPGELDTAQRALYDAITAGPRAAGRQLLALTDDAGGLVGPFNAMLRNPAIGLALQEVGAAVRYRGGLSDRVREMAILLVAARWDSAFERAAHTATGRAAGLTEVEISLLNKGLPPPVTDPDEACALAVVRRLLDDADLDDQTYDDAAARLGEAALLELTTLVGYYATLALQLRVFRVE